METVESSLLSFILSSFPRGSVFFLEDLESSGIAPDAIRFNLSQIVLHEHGVVRLARGVFCVPEIDPESGTLLMPSVEALAGSLARRWRVRIAPTGAQAAWLSGLTGFTAEPYTWVSDGSDQEFNLKDGRVFRFVKRKSLKVFRFRDERMRNLSEGLRYIGRAAVGDFEEAVVRRTVSAVPDDVFRHDVMLAPFWVRELMCLCRQSCG